MTCQKCFHVAAPDVAVNLRDRVFIRVACRNCEMRLSLTNDEERILMAEVMTGLTVSVAVAIINEAKSAGVTKSSMPETEEAKLALAERIVEMARQAHHKGSKRKDVATIVALAGAGREPDPEPEQADPEDHFHENGSPAVSEAPAEVAGTPASVEEAPVGTAAQEAINRVKTMNLPIPPPLDAATLPSVPRDTTVLSDGEVRRLYAQWGVVRNYAGWRLSCEEADLRALGHLLAYQRKQVVQGIPRADVEGKAKTVGLIEAEVDTTPEVAPLIEQHVALANSVNSLKVLFDIYTGNVERLSREMTFRDAEWRHRH